MSFIDCKIDGGFGNQLGKYAFARAYAEKYGATLRTSSWIGQELFGFDEPAMVEGQLPKLDNLKLERWDGRTDIAIIGEAQHQKHLIYTRETVRRWFALRDEFAAPLVTHVPYRRYVAHLRWGDFLGHDHFIAICRGSYLKAAEENGIDPRELTFVSQECALTIPARVPAFLPDFFQLMTAKVLFRGPSTFSWWAATLGNHERVFSPDQRGIEHRGSHRGVQDVPFVEGNHMPITAWWEGHSELHLRER